MAYTGSAIAFFFSKSIELEKIECIGKVLVKSILSNDVLARADQELKWMEKEGVNHLCYSDKHYPNR